MSFKDLSESLFDACLSAFGEEVEYRSKSGEAATIQGVFIREYLSLEQGTFDAAVSSAKSALEIKANVLPVSPALGDSLSVRGETYHVVEVQPNSEGQIKLILKRKK